MRLFVRVLLAVMLAAGLLAPQALAAEPTFGEPSATATLGEPVVISSTINGDDIAAVEVVVRLAGDPTAVVLEAARGQASGTWQVSAEIDIATSALCACHIDGQSAPNTRFEFQFRVLASDGTTTLGPTGRAVVTDERFEWRTLEQDLVRVHWYRGDEAFGRSAADVANEAIDRASELLGTSLDGPVDLFVYDTEEDLRSAVSPNRENVAGQAHAAIDTMFVWIPGDRSAEQFAGVLVAHELTHLVFDAATQNPYRGVPRWLDEGVAVYLSEGYAQDWRFAVEKAVRTRSLIPLDGLAGLFPSTRDEFYLAYGESVAAIDFFIRTYGEETLWALVRSYAQGVSDDEAFEVATGGDLAAFNRAWFESFDLEVPPPLGPQPAPPGPVPDDWQGDAPPVVTPGPTSPGTSVATEDPAATAVPGAPPARGPDQPSDAGQSAVTGSLVLVGWGIIVTVLLALAVIVLVNVTRGNRQRHS